MSHASATSRTLNSAREQAELRDQRRLWMSIVPSEAREKIEARSKRKPSTPIVRAQKRRLSSTSDARAGVAGAEGVAATGVVEVVPPVRREQVVAAVVDAAVSCRSARSRRLRSCGCRPRRATPRCRRRETPAPSSGIPRRPRRARRLVRREEVQRHVAPVVAFLRIELVHREQLDDGDAELLEVGNLLGQAGKRAAFRRCRRPSWRAR